MDEQFRTVVVHFHYTCPSCAKEWRQTRIVMKDFFDKTRSNAELEAPYLDIAETEAEYRVYCQLCSDCYDQHH